MRKPFPLCVLLSCLLSLSSAVFSQSSSIPLVADDWQISQSVEAKNDSFVIESGRAIHSGLQFQDGTLEVEMKVSGLRAFSYIQFRIDESGKNYEEIYFRTHKSLAPDALQYTPVDNGISAWQLYHDEGKTAPVALPIDQWIKVKMIVADDRAAVFVGDNSEQPDMVMHLARDTASGAVGLRGFVARGSTAPYSAHFRNLRISN